MPKGQLLEERLTRSVIGAFYEVYNTLGFGFLERLYVKALEIELRERGHKVVREYRVCVMYKGHELGTQRMDLIVDDKLIVETKSTYKMNKISIRQTYNYLKSTNIEVGMVLHFGPEAKFYRLVCTANEKRPVKSAQSVESA